MSSQDHHQSSRPSRSPKQTRNSRGSNISQKQSSVSGSSQAQNSGRYSLAESWYTSTSAETEDTLMSDASAHSESPCDKFVFAPAFNSHLNKEYAARVISGINGLGVYVPIYLLQASINKHESPTYGEYSYSTVLEEMEVPIRSQYLSFGDIDPTSQQGHWTATHEGRAEGLSHDLRGIGAQFEG